MEGKTISIADLSSNDRYFKSKGSIQHLDSGFLYVLRSEGGLKQYLEIFDKKTLQKVKEIDLREQNLSSMDSNENYIVLVYRKGASEIWEKNTWNLKQEFKYPNMVGYTGFITEDMLIVALYSSQCAIYFYDRDAKIWNLKGYPPIHSTPFIGAFYYNGLVYTGGLYEEILVSDFGPDRFKKLEHIETWGRYVDCIRVDDDYIYHHCEMYLGLYDRTKKEILAEPFEDHYDGSFDINEGYIYYSKEKGIVIRKKKSWDIKCVIDTGETQATDVFVDKSDLYFNDNEGNFYCLPIESLLI